MFNNVDNDEMYYRNRKYLFDNFDRSDVLRGEYVSPYRVDLIKEELNVKNIKYESNICPT